MANIHLGKVIIDDDEWDYGESEIFNVSNFASDGTILYLPPDYDSFGNVWESPVQPYDDKMSSIATSSSGKYSVLSIRDDAIWYSRNHGETWLQSNSIIGDWSKVGISAMGQYASVGLDGSGIYYSDTFGKTWTASTSPSDTWNAIALSSTGVNQIACSDTKVYLSTDYGLNWS